MRDYILSHPYLATLFVVGMALFLLGMWGVATAPPMPGFDEPDLTPAKPANPERRPFNGSARDRLAGRFQDEDLP